MSHNILHRLRTEAGYTVTDLAQALSISPAAISRYENRTNPRVPHIKILMKYARFFRIDIHVLCDYIFPQTKFYS